MLFFEIHGLSIRMPFACAHLASLDARGFICTKYVGGGHGGCRLCRPQRKLRQPLLCPFAVFVLEA